MFGGSGFIGSHVTEELIKHKAIVAVTVREKDEKHLKNIRHLLDKIEVIKADLLNEKECRNVVNEYDIVINLAAVDGSSKFKAKYPFEIFRDNVLITLNALSALKESKVKQYVQISSAAVYHSQSGFKNKVKETENIALPIEFPYAYSWSKLFSEIASKFFSQKYGMKVLIVRPNNIFGPRDLLDEERIRLIPFLIREIEKGASEIRLSGPGNRIMSFLFVEDFAINLLKMIELQKKSFDIVNIGSEEEVSLRELCHLIANLMNRKVNFIFDEDIYPPIRNVIDLEKAKNEYGFKQYTPLVEGLKKTIEWYTGNQLISTTSR